MKRIEFISPADGDLIINPNPAMLKILFLYVGGEFWNSGSGDSCLDYYDDKIENRIEILFSASHGFYLRFKAKAQDFHTITGNDYSETTTVYVGGNPVVLPCCFFIDREKALQAANCFCETGNRADDVGWIDDDDVEWNWEKHLV